MSVTYEKKDLPQIFSDISRRLQRLESGGRPIIGTSPVVSLAPIVLGAGVATDFSQLLEWPTASVTAVLGAIPYFRIYVDSDGVAGNLWPGGSLSAGQKNLQFSWILDLDNLITDDNKALLRGYLKNNDGSSHTYYIDIAFTYVAGASSS